MKILYLEKFVNKNTIYWDKMYKNKLNMGKNRSKLTNNENHSQI